MDRLAVETDRQRPPQWIDYFVFSRGLRMQARFRQFVVGRPGWDNWLLWYPLSIGVPVVDASRRGAGRCIRIMTMDITRRARRAFGRARRRRKITGCTVGSLPRLANASHLLTSRRIAAELWGRVDFGSAVRGEGVVLGLVWVVEFDAAGAALVGSA